MNDEKVSTENDVKARCFNDIASLSRTDLRKKYQAEYNSWRNRKASAKPDGNWSADFEEFPDFLRYMGPMPEPGMTLDRKDPRNPRYAPNLCRWATPREQANNRTTTRSIRYEGVAMPLSEASRKSGQNPTTVRQRLKRRWDVLEALSGRRRDGKKVYFENDPRDYWPWPKNDDPGNQSKWEQKWLISGGIRLGNTRYEFLIKTLHAMLKDHRAKLWQLYEDGLEGSDAYDQELAHGSKVEALLVDAEEMYPQWADAVRLFEAAQREQRAMRGRNYLEYEEPEDF